MCLKRRSCTAVVVCHIYTILTLHSYSIIVSIIALVLVKGTVRVLTSNAQLRCTVELVPATND